MPYVVLTLEKSVTLSAPWMAKNSVTLSFADGMIGAMPVFETREWLLNYRRPDHSEIDRMRPNAGGER